MSTPRALLYCKPGCPWCDDAEDYLREHGIAFDTVDILANRAAYAEMQQLTGQTKAPSMRWGDEFLADFGAEELDVFLRARGVVK